MIEDSSLVFVGNKSDLIDNQRVSELKKVLEGVVAGRDLIFVSATKGHGLDQIREKVSEVQRRNAVIVVDLPDTDAAHSLLSRLYGSADISSEMTDRGMKVTLRCLPADADKFSAWLAGAGGVRMSIQKPDEGTPS